MYITTYKHTCTYTHKHDVYGNEWAHTHAHTYTGLYDINMPNNKYKIALRIDNKTSKKIASLYFARLSEASISLGEYFLRNEITE